MGGAAVFTAGCWAYSLAARYTDFFFAPKTEKTAILVSLLILTSLLSAWLFLVFIYQLIKSISKKNAIIFIGLSCLVVAAVFSIIYRLPPFPEHHNLSIKVMTENNPLSESTKVEIVSLSTVSLPAQKYQRVPFDELSLVGDWHGINYGFGISAENGPDLSASFERFMQAGVAIEFLTGPRGGMVQISWDGDEQIIDLYSPTTGTYKAVLEPKLDWRGADLTRKILVAGALISDYEGLSVLFFVIILLINLFFSEQKFVVRKTGLLFLCLVIVLTMQVTALKINKEFFFENPQVEDLVRDELKQPDGAIFQRQLLTIVKLNASGHKIDKLDGIQYLRNLESLNLRNNSITDITQISHLDRLRKLDLRGNLIRDISPLANLSKLESLNLRGNPIADISPLTNLNQIRELNLNGIPLGDDIALLGSFYNLIHLNIRNCSVTDISVLADLMSHGVLQDNPDLGKQAKIDIRNNPISRKAMDGFATIRPYWEHISERVPFILPVFNTLSVPLFSYTGGFYEKDFWLTLTTQDPLTTIHYTLDSSEPTQDSPLYIQPLNITSRASEPNKVSAISTTSPNWEEPIGEVFKATVVRAKAFHSNGSHSATITHTYFVDKDIANHYSLPIVSVNTDMKNLFDNKLGIYVIGQGFDKSKSRIENSRPNYHKRGGEWERPVHLEFFDISGNRFFAQDSGARIHGATTRRYPQKSLRFYANNSYGQSDYFDYEFFPGLRDSVQGSPLVHFKTLLLRNSGNNWDIPMSRDALMYALFSHTSLDTLANRPVIMFLNGEYWGIYNLRENLDVQYLAAHYQVDPQQIAILERSRQVNSGEPGDETHYEAMLDYIRTHDINYQDDYSYVSTQMDIENFIDYQISEIYASNPNWPDDNIKFWRYKTETYQPEAPYGQDGRWRWLLFDLDTAFGVGGGSKDNTLQKAESAFLFRSLTRNSEFRRQFINRFADHLNTSLTPQRVISIIDKMQAALTPEIPEHIDRWHIMEGSMEVWEKNVDAMRIFARERPVYVRQHIMDYFELTGTSIITLLTDNTKGHIRINSIDITPDTPGVMDGNEWSGTYFKGIPVKLSAIPNPGFKFAGWDGNAQTKPQISIMLEEDLILTAKFVPIN